MAQTTSLVFNGGAIPSPAPTPSGSGKAKLLKIGEITITEQGEQVTKKVICDPDSVTTVAPFMEVLTSAKLAELVEANSILVLDDGDMQYLMANANITVEEGISVCTAVNFLGLSKENRAKVAYDCTRITDELTLQQVVEVGEPVETNFNLVIADSEDTAPDTLIDKMEVVDAYHDPDDPDSPPMLLQLDTIVDDQGKRKVAIDESALSEVLDAFEDEVGFIEDQLGELPSDEHGYFNSSLYTTPGDGTTTNLVMSNFRISENRGVHGDSIEFVPTHQEGGIDFGEVYLEPGTYILATQFTLQWVGNPRGTFLSQVSNVADQPFDFSYEHEDVVRTTRIVTRTTRGKLVLNIAIDADTPSMGVWVKSLEVAQIASYNHPAVTHDSTLAGSGQIGDPLGVTPAAFGKVKDIPTSISQFRTGDVIPVDGPNGPVKMGKDDLLTETAQSTLAGNVAPAFVPNSTTTIAGLLYVYNGLLYMAKEAYQGPWDESKFNAISQDQLFAFKQELSAICQIYGTQINDFIVDGGIIDSSLKWVATTNPNYKHILVRVNHGDVLEVVNNAVAIRIVYLERYEKAYDGNSPSIVSNSVISANATYKATVPASTNYVLIPILVNGTDSMPDNIIVNGCDICKPLSDKLYGLSDELSTKVKGNSKNLIDLTKATSGYYVKYSTGQLSANADFSASDFIRIDAGEDYTFSVQDYISRPIPQLAFYGKFGEYISGLANGGVSNSLTFTAPAGVYFVRLSLYNDYKTRFQFEKGSAVTDLEPYKFMVSDDNLPLHAPIAPKNLFDISSAAENVYVNYGNGALVSNSDYIATDYIPVEEGTKYTYSIASGASVDFIPQMAFYDASKAYISGLPNSGKRFGLTVVAPVGAKYMRWSVLEVNKNYVMIEKGDVATRYVPHNKKFVPQQFIDEKPNYVVVSKNGAGYTSILRALKETDPSVEIRIENGTYDIVAEYVDYYGSDFFDNYDGYLNHADDPFYRGLWLERGRKITGDAKVKLQFNYSGGNTDVDSYFSILNPGGNNIIEDLELTADGHCRYLIHDDFLKSNFPLKVKYNRLKFSGDTYTNVIVGAGIGNDAVYEYDSCVFDIPSSSYLISYHGSTAADAKAKIYIKNSIGVGKVGFRWMGTSPNITDCVVCNCKFTEIVCIPYDASQTVENMRLIQFNNTIGS